MAKPIKLAIAVTSVAMLATACGGSSSGGGTSTGAGSDASSSAAGGDSGGKTLSISSDLPLQGSSKDSSVDTNNAIRLYLDQVGNKAGKFNIKFTPYDDSTAAKGSWDDGTCASNATKHVATKDEVAVMGTFNSGCAKIEAPVLNQDPNGPMLMVSHANTNPGLTKTWDPGEPEKYFPTGKRNYARVVTTDDYQGAAAADFLKNDLKVTRCYVVNDNQTYGQGIAQAFIKSAKEQGITILGNTAWDNKQPNYTALFQSIKAKNPDCVYVAGIYELNGGQVVKDKVKVLGDNTAIKLMAPDGFTGYPDLKKLPQAQGMYLTFAGLSTSQLIKGGGPGAKLVEAYKAKYGKEPSSNYALYGVSAVQVILAAIAKSDGTRKGVNDAIFSGEGISLSATESVLGKDIAVDPKTGDINAKDISVELMKGNEETYVRAAVVK